MEIPEALVTDRLTLRRPNLADAQAVFDNYASDPRVTKYLVWPPHRDLGDTREFLTRTIASRDAGTSFSWGIEECTRPGVIGMIAVRPRGSRVDLGYVLGRSFWGRGLMTEAVDRVARWFLGQQDVFRVWATCDVENLASARVLEKVGMIREGILRSWEVHPNIQPTPRDAFVFSRVKRDDANFSG